jgi:hypothetical protein
MRAYGVGHLPAFKADLHRIAEREPWRFDDVLAALEAASVLLRQFPELGQRMQINGTWSMIRRS